MTTPKNSGEPSPVFGVHFSLFSQRMQFTFLPSCCGFVVLKFEEPALESQT